jgi:hypothetical protein
MYTFLRYASVRESLLADAPAFVVSMVIAEVFYKFHSFTLECLCFLATWLAISSAFALAARRLFGNSSETS